MTLTTDRFGISNNAYAFNGSEIDIPDAQILDFTSAITISIWVQATNSWTNHSVLLLRKGLGYAESGYSLNLNQGSVEAPNYDGNAFITTDSAV